MKFNERTKRLVAATLAVFIIVSMIFGLAIFAFMK